MRRSARVAAAIEVATSALSPLPLPVVHRIFLMLRVDERARAACVCRGWRAVLAEPSLWTRLNLSTACGIEQGRDISALLRGAAEKARGQLCQIDLLGWQHRLAQHNLLEVVAANASSLRELRVGISTVFYEEGADLPTLQSLQALMRAAPQLQSLEAVVFCSWMGAHCLLRADPPYAVVRLLELRVLCSLEADIFAGLDRVGPFAALLADPALQPTLTSVGLSMADTREPGLMNALVDAMLSRQRVRELSLFTCPPPAPAPLARLLRDGVLTSLKLKVGPRDAADAVLVADALRQNNTLTSLTFNIDEISLDVTAACTLLGAMVGHSSLCSLRFYFPQVPRDAGALGIAFAALVAADAPALQNLSFSDAWLGDAGLAPVVDALHRNHYLRKLNLCDTRASEAFTRERLLPALHANSSLRELLLGDEEQQLTPAESQAVALVRSRTQQ